MIVELIPYLKMNVIVLLVYVNNVVIPLSGVISAVMMAGIKKMINAWKMNVMDTLLNNLI